MSGTTQEYSQPPSQAVFESVNGLIMMDGTQGTLSNDTSKLGRKKLPRGRC